CLSNLAFEVSHSRLSRVALDYHAERVIADLDLVRLQAVCFHLPANQIASGDLQLLVGGVADEADNLHPIAQRPGDGIEHIRRGDEDHPVAQTGPYCECYPGGQAGIRCSATASGLKMSGASREARLPWQTDPPAP